MTFDFGPGGLQAHLDGEPVGPRVMSPRGEIGLSLRLLPHGVSAFCNILMVEGAGVIPTGD